MISSATHSQAGKKRGEDMMKTELLLANMLQNVELQLPFDIFEERNLFRI